MDADTPIPIQVTTGPLPASRKVYTGDSARGLRVPHRDISLHPSAGEPPLRVYDTSGPYTDPAVNIDIEAGLPRWREAWVEARGDTRVDAGRPLQDVDNGNQSAANRVPSFQVARRPRQATGAPETQLAYARRGIVTPEMEFIAERE
ncbi:MAG: phosphomethylpyrimidine synthase ThiC, partial [Rhodospirillales bacterium]|nr:phosphomethylpyrimidine synthase ThiC [Rhodospirillales bacterium]